MAVVAVADLAAVEARQPQWRRRVKGISRRLRGRLFELRVHHPVAATRCQTMPHLTRGGRHTVVRLGGRNMFYRGVHLVLDGPGAVIEIGERTYINPRSEVMARERVTIGERCAISWDVCITDSDQHSIGGRPFTKPVSIGDHVWIGLAAKVLKGVTIGDDAIIGAGAVVTRDVPARCLAAGNPAKVIRENIPDWSDV